MLPFGVTILNTAPQRSEIPDGLMNYPVFDVKVCVFRNIFSFFTGASSVGS
jgi:hypothetical protein